MLNSATLLNDKETEKNDTTDLDKALKEIVGDHFRETDRSRLAWYNSLFESTPTHLRNSKISG